MTAIRRILQSISGKYPDLYPQLEAVLEQPILITLNDIATESTDEGLTCLSELIYNQPESSERMWNFFQLIVQSIMEGRGILEQFSEACFAVIINMMNRNPENFKSLSLPSGNGQTMTPLDMTLALGQKCFQLG